MIMSFIRNLFKKKNVYVLKCSNDHFLNKINYWVEKNGHIIFDSYSDNLEFTKAFYDMCLLGSKRYTEGILAKSE